LAALGDYFLTIGILLIHLSPNNLYPETHEFVDRINSDTERTHTRFVARHGWILAIGDIKRLLRSTTLAGWTARRTGRLYKEDCWRPLITGVPFDQSPSAYLYPEHAPERPPIVGRVEEPKWNYQRLLADQPAHNARLGSYWSLGVASDGTVGLSKIIRSIGSLNIKTIEARNHMIANLEHDFSPRDEAKVA
jgi:hypothetical protein